MAEKYRKLGARIWRDEKFTALDEVQKLVAIYCLTAQVNRCGIFVFSPAMAAEELNMDMKTFRKVFAAVIAALKWQWDAERRVLWFPRWWKYNTPENLNVLKGCITDLRALPNSPLLASFWKNTEDLSGTHLQTFVTLAPNVTGTLPERLAIQETETEQETEKETEKGRSETFDADDPLKTREKQRKEFEAAWNAAGLMPLTRLTRGLWTKLEGLLLDPDWRNIWRDALIRAGKSPFLAKGTGSNSGPMDPAQFLRDDDFAASILRGRFDPREVNKPPPKDAPKVILDPFAEVVAREEARKLAEGVAP